MHKSKGDAGLIKALDSHIEEHFGGNFYVLDEIDSPLVHVDLFIVPPAQDRPYHVLFTCGMAEKPMTVPEGFEPRRFAELTLSLPQDWPMTKDAWKDERWWWPLRLLKQMARYPHENETWLGFGHSVPGSTSGVPFAANTQMTDIAVLEPRTISEEAATFHDDDRGEVSVWALFPVYPSEKEFKHRRSAQELQQLFDSDGVTELVQPGRGSVIPFE